ncbi:MAG: creatininase family protein [Candidatus Brocadiaceae bacterium]|nr:creatininase family protein [Candidatus Brocadiaceae bacterium]
MAGHCTADDGSGRSARPIEQGDWNMAYLFPQEVVEARERIGLVILPVAPVEWHGPHVAMGCDNLLAHAFAREVARELRCPYYPPLFVGTERERPDGMLRAIGFDGDEFIEGMDFPGNSIGSGYYREEVFAAVVRDTLEILFDRMGFRRVLIVNGHGATNQKGVLDRLCAEYNAGVRNGKRVLWTYPGFPAALLGQSIGHADAAECSMLAASFPECLDLSQLPQDGRLRNTDFAIVDGETFDGKGTRDHTVRLRHDPRKHTDPEQGRRYFAEAVREVVDEVSRTLLGPSRRRG